MNKGPKKSYKESGSMPGMKYGGRAKKKYATGGKVSASKGPIKVKARGAKTTKMHTGSK